MVSYVANEEASSPASCFSRRQSRQRHVGPEVTGASLLFRPHTILLRESGDVPSGLKGGKLLSPAARTQPASIAADGIRGGGVCSAPRAERDESFFELAGIEDKQKRPSGRSRRAFCSANSRRSVFRCVLRSRGRNGHFRFRAAQPPHGVGAHAPEDRELRNLGFPGLAVLALVLRADELSVNEDMIALPERVRDGLAEAVKGHDAVPLVV